VVIYSCSSSNSATSCESSSELATISGSSISSSRNWTSTTGYMRVRFTSDKVTVASDGKATVACSGSCSCPAAAAAQSGSITDGSGSYSNGEDCSWVISSVGRSIISISFSQFETESGSDKVVIYSCSSSSCESSSELARISGSSISSSMNWKSTTGYMRVRFTSDSSVTYAGFIGNWTAWNKAIDGFVGNWSTETCVLCPVGKSSAVVGANNDTTCALCGAGAYPGDSDGVYVGAGASVCSDCCKQDFAVADEFDKISSSYRFGKYDADADGR